ncbi:MAG: nicotinate-nucleotide adenylyltransferase [Roseburia sp.]|nr:nicotinate-nucleotide adenylyltransferase [Lachnospiraceae bacterium]
MPAKKIGIMGGTFNPIHYGHLILAENAATQYGLDKIWFMPTGNPPHKKASDVLDVKDRVEMVSLAIRENPKFELSLYEAQKSEFCYTAQTLSELKEKFPGQDYFFIMGADSLFDFEMWKNPDIICRKASILAAIRDDIDRKELNEQINYLKQKYDANIFELNTPNFSVSSHNIRNRVENGASIRYLLPDVVISYIREHNLYQERNHETESDRH